ncbi:MAG: hypothetical protein QHH05_06580 [Syntrophomonadaceae bacterium]|nr:hypothetical protein [Syntrophomonadaceae bacterium]
MGGLGEAVGVLGAETMARAIRNAALHAESVPGIPARRDLV